MFKVTWNQINFKRSMTKYLGNLVKVLYFIFMQLCIQIDPMFIKLITIKLLLSSINFSENWENEATMASFPWNPVHTSKQTFQFLGKRVSVIDILDTSFVWNISTFLKVFMLLSLIIPKLVL